MDNLDRPTYDYFLATDGIDIAQARSDLVKVFNRHGETHRIDQKSFGSRYGLHVCASLKLSKDQIAGLEGRTNTPLQRLQRFRRKSSDQRSAPSVEANPRSPSSPLAMTESSLYDQGFVGPPVPITQSRSRRPSAPATAMNPRPVGGIQEQEQEHSITRQSGHQHMTPYSNMMAQNSSTSPYGNEQQLTSPNTMYSHPNAMPQPSYALVAPTQMMSSRQHRMPNQPESGMMSYSASQLYGASASGNIDPSQGSQNNPTAQQRSRQQTHSSNSPISPSQNTRSNDDMFYFQPRIISNAEVQRRRDDMNR